MIKIHCDVCGTVISEVNNSNEGNTVTIAGRDLCAECQRKDLEKEWAKQLVVEEKEWAKKEKERRKFNERNLARLKEEYLSKKRKSFLGK